MIKTMCEKVLIVGAGMTGASVASLLRQDLQKSVTISVWEKSKGTGGRMSTSRSNKVSGSTVDLGAQYISATPDYQQKHQRFYTELLDKGILSPLQGEINGHQDKITGTKHYVVPEGVSSLVKYYLNKAGPLLGCEHLVTDISMTTNNKVKVSTGEGHNDVFDTVIITIPVPQILQLQGDIADMIARADIKADLETVSYSSRFATGLFYEAGTTLDVPWSAKYITDNPCIRYVAVDDRKRGKDSPSVGPSICVHTGAPWALKNIERDKDEAAQEIIQHLHSVIPNLPQPVEVKGHKWRYSQVHKSYPGSPGCVVLCENPTVILAGDAFVHSNFDGCLQSAISVQTILSSLVKSKV